MEQKIQTFPIKDCKCEVCRVSLIPTFVAANGNLCLSCMLNSGLNPKPTKGSMACFLDSKRSSGDVRIYIMVVRNRVDN